MRNYTNNLSIPHLNTKMIATIYQFVHNYLEIIHRTRYSQLKYEHI